MSAGAGEVTRSAAAAAAGPPRRDALGYSIVLVSYLGMAGSAPLVAWAGAPVAIILALRMAFAAFQLPGIAAFRGRAGAVGERIARAQDSIRVAGMPFYNRDFRNIAAAQHAQRRFRAKGQENGAGSEYRCF